MEKSALCQRQIKQIFIKNTIVAPITVFPSGFHEIQMLCHDIMSKSNRPKRPAKKRNPPQNRSPRTPERSQAAPERPKGPPWFYGRHAVMAILQNDKRHCHRLLATSEFINSHGEELNRSLKATTRKRPDIEIQDRHTLDDLTQGAVHQGIAVQTDPLPRLSLEDVLPDMEDKPQSIIVVLDQATDPQNIGAVMRSCAAFGADGVIIPDKNAPEITPSMAKTACGALERLPFIRITNLARSLDQLKEHGFWTVGLDGYADQDMAQVDLKGKTVLVMGNEGSGLRRLTKEKCDFLVKIPITQAVESLNLSNATAVALYECARQRS